MKSEIGRLARRSLSFLAAQFIAVMFISLSLVGCSGSAPVAEPPQATPPFRSPVRDSQYFTSAGALLKASDALLLVDVGDSKPADVEGVAYLIYQVEVVASYPTLNITQLEIAAIPDNGTAETINLVKGRRYALFVMRPKDGPAQLASPSQGVFVVNGSKAGESRMDTFPLGELGSKIGLR